MHKIILFGLKYLNELCMQLFDHDEGLHAPGFNSEYKYSTDRHRVVIMFELKML